MSKSKVKYTQEELSFLQNKSLMLNQLRHEGVKVVNHMPVSEQISINSLKEMFGPNIEQQVRVIDRGGMVDATNIGEIARALGQAEEGAIIVRNNPGYAQASATVAPSAIGHKVFLGVDQTTTEGVLAYGGKTAHRKEVVAAAHNAVKKSGLAVATVFVVIENGKPAVQNMQVWETEVPDGLVPYLKVAVEGVSDADCPNLAEQAGVQLATATAEAAIVILES